MKRSTPRPSRSCACSREDGIAILHRAAERADRAGDEDVRAGHLARVARDLHRGLVDRRDVVLEVVLGELAAIRAERVRLDDVRAGADEAEVEREDALGRADVRLLGAAQPRDGARDERAHAAVADERRAVRESLEEPAHRRIPPRPRRLDRRTLRGVSSALPTGTVTFLFTDVEGSTRLLEELGAEALRRGARAAPGDRAPRARGARWRRGRHAGRRLLLRVRLGPCRRSRARPRFRTRSRRGRSVSAWGSTPARLSSSTGTTWGWTCIALRGSAPAATAGRSCSRRRPSASSSPASSSCATSALIDSRISPRRSSCTSSATRRSRRSRRSFGRTCPFPRRRSSAARTSWRSSSSAPPSQAFAC